MEKRYKYYMLCRDLSKTTPFLRADGSPLITTALNEREAWNKFRGLFEASLASQDYLCEVELTPIKHGEDDTPASAIDSSLELDTALEGLKNVLRDQGRLANKNL